MNILSAKQMREADQYTIIHEPILSIDLMERAARACLYKLLRLSDDETLFYIFCGQGNNGGDGLALARLLSERNRRVQIFIIEHREKTSSDFDHNLERLLNANKVTITYLHEGVDTITFPESEDILIIDALIGSGIRQAVSGLMARVIEQINASYRKVVAIDIPSGLIPDGETDYKQPVVRAGLTLSFQQPKLAFMFAENVPYIGEFEILDIGLDKDFINNQSTPYNYLNKSFAASLLIPRGKFSHKGTYGHALLISGSVGKSGAALLAAKACLRCGAGLLTVHIPACAHTIMQTALPEAMVSLDTESNYISSLPDVSRYSAIGIGPGLGTEKQTQQVLKLLIQNAVVPLVIDADALNILAENKTWLAFLPPQTILTPHPKEFDRMAGNHSSAFSRLQSAREMARKFNCIIILKGAHTAIVMPNGKVHFNSTGNPALAKGGSGDVLTGMISGLLARGYEPSAAAILGVFLHGLTADIIVKKINPESVLAGDIIEKIGKAFDKLQVKDK